MFEYILNRLKHKETCEYLVKVLQSIVYNKNTKIRYCVFINGVVYNGDVVAGECDLWSRLWVMAAGKAILEGRGLKSICAAVCSRRSHRIPKQDHENKAPETRSSTL